MQKRLTWILTLLALALFAFIYLFERKLPGAAERNAAPRLFAELEPADVNAIEVTLAGGGVVRAEQTNGTWFLTRPLYPADQSTIETFVTNVVRMRRIDRLAHHEVAIQGQKSFGFEPPRATVQVETPTNQFRFDVGGLAPLTNNIYLRFGTSSEVVLSQADLLSSLPRTTNDWRSNKLLDLARLDFDHLQIRNGQRMFELGRNPTNSLWQITRPIPARGDQGQITALFDQLNGARVERFLGDGVVDVEPYGLQTPEVELGFNRGTNRLFTIGFGGSVTNATNSVYVRLVGNTNVVTVSRELAEYLKQPYKAFHDPRLFTLGNPSALDRITVQFQEPFSIQRQPGGRWVVGEGVPADLELLGEFLTRILFLRIFDIAKEVPTDADLQNLGFQPPIASYSFFEKHTNSSGIATNVLYSQLSFGTNATDRIHVRRSDETPIYLTELAKVIELPRHSYELRDRQLWSFPTSSVVKLSIVSSTGTNSSVRTGTGWFGDALANEAINEAVFRLSKLKAARWVTKGQERKKAFGIVEGSAILEVELKTENETEVRRIHFGKLTMRRDVYAITLPEESDPVIFEFPGEIYHLLIQNLPAAK